MQIVATQKSVRQSSRKVGLVANAVRKLPLEQAVRQLTTMERRASLVVLKVLKQAVANAVNNHRLAFADLELKNITVTEGPTYKRWQAVSRGRAHSIMKRTSHIQVVLETRSEALSQRVGEPAVQDSSRKTSARASKTNTQVAKTETKKTATKTTTKAKVSATGRPTATPAAQAKPSRGAVLKQRVTRQKKAA